MEIQKTILEGCYILIPKIYEDNRGYFFESFHHRKLNELLKSNIQFVQDNQAMSNYGTIRGLHFQKPPYQQAKLVSVIHGSVLDVVVDLREESPSYLKFISVLLSGNNKKQLFVPKGFAHGYAVLEDNSIFHYKCDEYYHPEVESGIHPFDPTLNIDWQIPESKRILSDKDLKLPFLNISKK